MKLLFPYIAQAHQIPHSLPIALELAARQPDWDIRIASVGATNLAFIRRLMQEYAPDSRIKLETLQLDPLSYLRQQFGHAPIKAFLLMANRSYYESFDAIITPERTSLWLRSMGVRRPRLIWTRHGAGDRGIGFAANVRHFDYVLVPGSRVEARLLNAGLIQPGRYTKGIYAKFDWLQPQVRSPLRLFDNDRPTVLYNPHFSITLSSWFRDGHRILEQFARSHRYNLIFAPHIRLFDPPSKARYAAFKPYADLPNVHIDLGSDRSIDMSYTASADCYLGDVSSQVAEFLYRPRPCLFLNSHNIDWRHDPNYNFWSLGPVISQAQDIESQVDATIQQHRVYAEAQARYFEASFDLPAGQRSAGIAADAIAGFLRSQINSEPKRSGDDSPSGSTLGSPI